MAEFIWKKCKTKKGTNKVIVIYDETTFEIKKIVSLIEDKYHQKVCKVYPSLNFDKKDLVDSIAKDSKEIIISSQQKVLKSMIDGEPIISMPSEKITKVKAVSP